MRCIFRAIYMSHFSAKGFDNRSFITHFDPSQTFSQNGQHPTSRGGSRDRPGKKKKKTQLAKVSWFLLWPGEGNVFSGTGLLNQSLKATSFVTITINNALIVYVWIHIAFSFLIKNEVPKVVFPLSKKWVCVCCWSAGFPETASKQTTVNHEVVVNIEHIELRITPRSNIRQRLTHLEESQTQ